MHRVEFGDRSLSPSTGCDLLLNLRTDASANAKENASASADDCRVRDIAEYVQTSYSQEDNEREQSLNFEVKKAIVIHRNQSSMRLSGREAIVQYESSLELEYTEFCRSL